MVERERHFDSVGALLSRQENPTGVVYQHVEAVQPTARFASEAPDRRLGRQIGHQRFDGARARLGADLIAGEQTTLDRAPDDNDTRRLRGPARVP